MVASLFVLRRVAVAALAWSVLSATSACTSTSPLLQPPEDGAPPPTQVDLGCIGLPDIAEMTRPFRADDDEGDRTDSAFWRLFWRRQDALLADPSVRWDPAATEALLGVDLAGLRADTTTWSEQESWSGDGWGATRFHLSHPQTGPFELVLTEPEHPASELPPDLAVVVNHGHFETDGPNLFRRFEDWQRLASLVPTVTATMPLSAGEAVEQAHIQLGWLAGREKFGHHLLLDTLAADFLEVLGYRPRATVGHSMGGTSSVFQAWVDPRFRIASFDTAISDLATTGPGGVDQISDLYGAGFQPGQWTESQRDAMGLAIQNDYGRLDVLRLIEALMLAEDTPASAGVFREGLVAPPILPHNDALIDYLQLVSATRPHAPANELHELLRLGPLADLPTQRGCVVGEAPMQRHLTLWQPDGWGALSARVWLPDGPPQRSVLLVPGWYRDPAELAESAAALAAEGALVMVPQDLHPSWNPELLFGHLTSVGLRGSGLLVDRLARLVDELLQAAPEQTPLVIADGQAAGWLAEWLAATRPVTTLQPSWWSPESCIDSYLRSDANLALLGEDDLLWVNSPPEEWALHDERDRHAPVWAFLRGGAGLDLDRHRADLADRVSLQSIDITDPDALLAL